MNEEYIVCTTYTQTQEKEHSSLHFTHSDVSSGNDVDNIQIHTHDYVCNDHSSSWHSEGSNNFFGVSEHIFVQSGSFYHLDNGRSQRSTCPESIRLCEGMTTHASILIWHKSTHSTTLSCRYIPSWYIHQSSTGGIRKSSRSWHHQFEKLF